MESYLSLQRPLSDMINPLKSHNFKIQTQENNRVCLFEEMTNQEPPLCHSTHRFVGKVALFDKSILRSLKLVKRLNSWALGYNGKNMNLYHPSHSNDRKLSTYIVCRPGFISSNTKKG